MNIPRQMINLVGIVVVVALLVAGATLIVLPMYSSARAIDGETASVAQTNQLYDVQVATLTGAQERIEELTGEVTGLRRQIPASSQLDDVMQIVVDSARATGATIESVSAADAEPWMPRTGLAGDDDAGTAPVEEAAPAPEGDEAEGDTAESTDPADASETAADPAAEAVAEAVSPQQQIPVTIAVQVPDARSAAAFMDALGRGPRLLAPIDGTLEEGTLTVTALALVRTKD
ncbi:hypothetical protein [Microbacterium flavescens]|uniref:hypothetical protein n=1 Tax=Microbacterium flavescens TaxID=69366 RepID=UPI001BDE3013|nr:hypothetical protein [Microbacterium flavescens]